MNFSVSVQDLHKKIKAINPRQLKDIPEDEFNNFKNYKIFPIELLVPANWNYKTDDAFMAQQLLNNIKRNGQIVTCQLRLLDTGYYEVVDGNHRLVAFYKLGKKFVIAYDHGKISLDEARRIAVETNETNFDADVEKLSKLLQEIKIVFPEDDLMSTMPFSEEEFGDLLDAALDDTNPELEDIDEDNFETEIPEVPKTQRGDLYELNEHRLLCGDSTNEDDVRKLMNHKIAHLLYTDPPYNVNYAEFNMKRGSKDDPHGKDWTALYCSGWKDDMSDEDYQKFLTTFLSIAKKYLIEYAHYYIWHATTYFRELIQALVINEIPYDKVPIIWKKQVAPLSWVHYKRIHEPCVFAGKDCSVGNGKNARWFGPNNETTVWEISREHNGNYIHPTQKPLALSAKALNNSSKEGELVLDLFLGSGSTLITSDILKRVCYGMELEPQFCDLIVQRFIQHCKENNKECIIKRNGEIINKNFFDAIAVDSENGKQI
ncbi:MAG: ParB N-terminal domain-containing protein [Bacteroidetes bacterium]|nr:ParB N-terminal domain-containing protein [Bacteroidota bacterium]